MRILCKRSSLLCDESHFDEMILLCISVFLCCICVSSFLSYMSQENKIMQVCVLCSIIKELWIAVLFELKQ